MHDDDGEAPRRPRIALRVWAICCAALIVPSLLVWVVRATAFALHCAPGPDRCHGMVLGAGLRNTLELAWMLPANSLLLLVIAFTAAIAAVVARRVLLGAITLVAVPIIALLLPMMAVFSATHDRCEINEGGVGDCPLWGATMGMAFHQAANVTDLVYGFAPYTFSAALMLGMLGWFFTRPRKPRAATAASMRMPERRPPDGGRLG